MATRVNVTTIGELSLSATVRVVWPATKELAGSAQNPPLESTNERPRPPIGTGSEEHT